MGSQARIGQKRGSRSLAVVLVSAFALALLIPQQASAFTTTGCRYATWSRAVQFGTMANSDYSTSLTRAMSRWSIATDINMYTSSNSVLDAFTANLNNTNINGQSNWSCTNGWTTWSNARLNTQNTTGFGTEKKTTVWLHELGHAMGLDHTGGLAAVMYSCPACAYNNYGTVYPTSDDIAGMNSLY